MDEAALEKPNCDPNCDSDCDSDRDPDRDHSNPNPNPTLDLHAKVMDACRSSNTGEFLTKMNLAMLKMPPVTNEMIEFPPTDFMQVCFSGDVEKVKR